MKGRGKNTLRPTSSPCAGKVGNGEKGRISLGGPSGKTVKEGVEQDDQGFL